MRINSVSNTPAATPIRPVFKKNKADLFKRNVVMGSCSGCRKPQLSKDNFSVGLFK